MIIMMHHVVSLKHDGTDGTAKTDGIGATGHRLAAKINLGALTQTENFVVKVTLCENFSAKPHPNHLSSC